MIKIIKNGNDKIFITRCAECASDLTYTLSDIHKREDEKEKFYTGYIYPYIICPVCNTRVSANLTTEEDNNKFKFSTLGLFGGNYGCPN